LARVSGDEYEDEAGGRHVEQCATQEAAVQRGRRAHEGRVGPQGAVSYGSVTAPRSAPVTSLAYLASTPVR
jgi:hypothetical protein